MERGYWAIGKIGQIPFFCHWTLLLWLPWCWWRGDTVGETLLSFPAFILLMAVHEYGHAFAAKYKRVRVDAIKLYLFHGMCEHEQPYYETSHVFIAWAGVLAQLALLLLALALQTLLFRFAPLSYFMLAPLFSVLITINCVIAAINLIPVAPLDGHIAWRIIPLFRQYYWPDLRKGFFTLAGKLNFRKKRAMKREAQRHADELLKRIKNKSERP